MNWDPDLAAQGRKSFETLYKGGKEDEALCDKWNKFCSSPVHRAKREEYARDETFMEMYLSALYATSVPSKRKRIRAFFEWFENRETEMVNLSAFED